MATSNTMPNAASTELELLELDEHSMSQDLSAPELLPDTSDALISGFVDTTIGGSDSVKSMHEGALHEQLRSDSLQSGETIVHGVKVMNADISSSNTHFGNNITVQCNEAGNEDLGWKDLADDNTVDSTQFNIINVPRLQNLYATYHESCAVSTATNSARMEMAKAFAFALLTHYFPKSQDYIVRPSSLGPMVDHGMSFILKADNGTDPTFRTQVKKAGPVCWNLVNTTKWHWIQPEDIASFEVMSKVEIVDKTTSDVTHDDRVHTHLAIMIDTFDEPPVLSQANVLHRGDILADVLGRTAEIRKGYGIVIYGPLIELYDFNFDEPEHTVKLMYVKPKDKNLGGGNLAVDMRCNDLAIVDQMLREEVLRRNVLYQDGVIGTGVTLPGGSADNTTE